MQRACTVRGGSAQPHNPCSAGDEATNGLSYPDICIKPRFCGTPVLHGHFNALPPPNVRSEQSGRSLPHDWRQQPLGPVSVLAAPKRRSGRSLLVSPFIPANPSMRSSVGRSPQCSMDRLHFFLFVRVVSPEGAPKIPVWPEPGSWHSVGTKTPCCPQFYCAEWSFVVLSASPRHRTGLGTDQPVKSPSRQLDARRASLICEATEIG